MTLLDRINKLKKLREAATKGEWHFKPEGFHADIGYYEPSVHGPMDEYTGIRPAIATIRVGLKETPANGKFIAAAANDAIPLLEEAASELEKANKEIAFQRRDCPQCRGGGWIRDSENGGIEILCDCASARTIERNKFKSEIERLERQLEAAETAIRQMCGHSEGSYLTEIRDGYFRQKGSNE
jgi:hypothetical protein